MKIGTYVLKHPALFLFRPKLKLVLSKKGKIRARLYWLWMKRKLKTVKQTDEYLLVTFKVEFIQIELVCRFYKEDGFEGFIDTPIGHFHLSGAYLKEGLSK